jgi:hypothetical protein
VSEATRPAPRGVALLLGAIACAALGWWAGHTSALPSPRGPITDADLLAIDLPVVEPPPGMTSDELRIACLPYMRSTATSLSEAQNRVEALLVRVADKESEVERLEAALREAGAVPPPPSAVDDLEPGRIAPEFGMAGQLTRARSELAQLKLELEEAVASRTGLETALTAARADLAATQQRLVAEERRSEDAREDVYQQTWDRFQTDAKLTLCAEGSRAAIERCRTAVDAELRPYERRFKACSRAGQAAPELRFEPNAALPFAVRIDAGDTVARGWQLVFCDNNLPEAPR